MNTIIVADIGGTNARFALAGARPEGGFELSGARSLPTAGFESFEDCLRAWLAEIGGGRGRDAVIAAAGPAVGNAVTMTNLGWRIDGETLGAERGLGAVRVVNDFVAMAWATQDPGDLRLAAVKDGYTRADAARLVMGPGTGLGIAALLPVGDRWTAVPGEGGHVACPAYGSFPPGVFAALAAAHPGLYLELVLSGRGLEHLQRALCVAAGEPARPLSASEVTEAALSGGDARCRAAVETFCRVLAEAARDFALTFGAFGGVFLAGGILPRIERVLLRSGFAEAFGTHPVYARLLAGIPVHLIREDRAAMLGAAAWYGGRIRGTRR